MLAARPIAAQIYNRHNTLYTSSNGGKTKSREYSSTHETGRYEPRIEVMLGEGEHRHTNVREDEILRQKIE